MSTLATQPADLNWKQEVNQRIAAHKSRRDPAAAGHAQPAATQNATNNRAAQAAARVAARYAKAPSYSQMLAEEARAAKRAAEAASQAALKMHAAAESVLAELETVATANEPAFEHSEAAAHEASASSTFFDPFLGVERPAARPPAHSEQRSASSALQIRWEPDMPVRPAAPGRAQRRPEQYRSDQNQPDQYSAAFNDWRGAAPGYGEPETVEPAQPIPANLIEFPRELIAPRRARPRIAEGPLSPERDANGQLSIFEVEPGAICTEPAAPQTAPDASAPDWSRIRLDAEQAPAPFAEPASAARQHSIHLAPLGLRLMASIVDFALIAVVFFAAALLTAANFDVRLPLKTTEILAAVAFLGAGVLYQAFFLLLAGTTPGMRYASIALCTFDDERPARAQLRRRIGAVLLSILPVGLGILWAIFDEDHLSWHDRISRTYQRCA